MSIDSGTTTSGTKGTITIGGTNAPTIQIGNTGTNTTITGTLVFSSNLSTGTGDNYLCMNVTTGSPNYQVKRGNGSACTASSRRFKHDITSISNSQSLAEVLQLQPVSFIYNAEIDSTGKPHIGFVAEDVNLIEPRVVTFEDDGVTPHGIDYGNLTAILAGAVQELNAKVNALPGSGGNVITIDQSNNVGIGISSPSTKLDVSGVIKSGIVGQVAGGVKVAGANTGSVTVTSAPSGSDWTMTLPTDAGQDGDILTTDGAGNTSWVNRSSITAPLRQEVFDVIGSATDSAQQSTIFGRLAKIETQDIADINTKLSVFTVFTDPVTLLKSLVFNVQTTFEQGITVLQDIVLAGRIKHTDQDTAGIAVIKSGDRQVHITFDRPYVTAPIINITSQGQKAEGYVKDITENGFTVSVDSSASADLRFSWSAVLIQNPRVSESTSSAVMTPTPTP